MGGLCSRRASHETAAEQQDAAQPHGDPNEGQVGNAFQAFHGVAQPEPYPEPQAAGRRRRHQGPTAFPPTPGPDGKTWYSVVASHRER